MARLAHHGSVVGTTQEFKEPARYAGVKIERRRQLHEERTALAPQTVGFPEKSLNRVSGASELLVMRNHPWDFD